MEKTCNICRSSMDPIFSGQILKKYKVQYFQCPGCGYVCTENPHWLPESYRDSINISDTGILARNIECSKIAATIIYFFFNDKSKFLDYAGGYGIFTRLMRDIGFDFYWYDLYTKNLVARGFEVSDTSDIELITCFECFEHLVNPMVDIEKMLAISHNIFFTTSLVPNPVPKPGDWWYYGLEHGQHVSFFSRKTFDFIALKYGFGFYSYGDIHIFTTKKIHPFFFRFIIRHSSLLFNIIVKHSKKSLTFSDMENIIKKGRELL